MESIQALTLKHSLLNQEISDQRADTESELSKFVQELSALQSAAEQLTDPQVKEGFALEYQRVSSELRQKQAEGSIQRAVIEQQKSTLQQLQQQLSLEKREAELQFQAVLRNLLQENERLEG